MPITISNFQARNLSLHIQGLSDFLNRRLTVDSLYDLVVRLGVVQVDSIRTVERARHLTAPEIALWKGR